MRDLGDVILEIKKKLEGLNPYDENVDIIEEINPLDVEIRVSFDKEIRDIILILATGGPHIELYLSNGCLNGYWSGGRVSVKVDNKELLDWLWDYYYSLWV